MLLEEQNYRNISHRSMEGLLRPFHLYYFVGEGRHVV